MNGDETVSQFDYENLSSDIAVDLKTTADTIRSLMQCAIVPSARIGKLLAQVENLYESELFPKWWKHEFGSWPREGLRYISAYEVSCAPSIVLTGKVNDKMHRSFSSQLHEADEHDLCVVKLSASGGDDQVARQMGDELRRAMDISPARRFAFIGHEKVYTAGTTSMSFFPQPHRYLTRGTHLKVADCQVKLSLQVNGPLLICIEACNMELEELELQRAQHIDNLKDLFARSPLEFDEVIQRSAMGWRMTAEEALMLKMVAMVL
jgi:hypothetical protein